ncbi:MAG: competence/damage-inducible protein A [Ignavibacteria bacterium]|nr:competence/damage-inducible protein A [Ignavibacteria bacterium]
MRAEVISVGDELLIGQVINSNQAYIGERLSSVGVTVARMTTVGDDRSDILRSFESALGSNDVVVVTGGLGPTHDDITRNVVCEFFQTDLVVNEEALQRVREIFRKRGVAPRKINEDQALVPRGCKVIQNLNGTAPGYLFERGGKYFIVMPGVPFEMKAMIQDFVVPFFAERASGLVIRHHMLKTTGIGESFLAEQIGNVNGLFAPNSGVSLAFLPSPIGTRLRITARGKSIAEVNETIRIVEEKIRAKAGKYIYGTNEDELEHIVGRLLTERRLALAVAESCTGGLITDRLTNVSGSSNYFERGAITYSNASKMAELGVPEVLIRQHGAVSREVAEAMAFGIRVKANTDIGISTTGIAGPTGATAEKPVGLVWIGYSDRSETLALKFNFGDDRRRVKERAAQAALELVRRKLLRIGVP